MAASCLVYWRPWRQKWSPQTWRRERVTAAALYMCLQVSFRQSPNHALRRPGPGDPPPLQGLSHLVALEAKYWVPHGRCCCLSASLGLPDDMRHACCTPSACVSCQYAGALSKVEGPLDACHSNIRGCRPVDREHGCIEGLTEVMDRG
jgi:hypothetical protein